MALPFLLVYLLIRVISDRAYARQFTERLGFLPQRFLRTGPGSVWLHAVSVGEMNSAIPLLKELRAQQPKLPIFVSTTTLAARKAGEQRLSGIADGLFYFPFDYVSCVRRVLRALRPNLVISLETEIWPNLYAETKRFGAGLALVNARISGRTWPRYRGMKWFFKPVLRLADIVFPQSTKDRERYFKLGVPLAFLNSEGNLKYDAPAMQEPMEFPTFGAKEVWIAASTVGPNESGSIMRHQVDEDDVVIEAFRMLARDHPRLLLIVAPRQQDRFDLVAEKLANSGLPFVRRTTLDPQLNPTFRLPRLELPGIVLLDTIGELPHLYHLANVAFVGGSIAPRGGHNILEPAGAGVPVVVGRHMQNFEAIVSEFVAAEALTQIQNPAGLEPAIGRLLNDPVLARELGRRGRAVVEQQQGASKRIAAKLIPLYQLMTPTLPHSWFARALLTPLSALWTIGGAIKRRRALRRRKELPSPVISIGGISAGGSGKTPFVNYLAGLLRSRGWRPAILTRGYRRRSLAKYLIFSAGADVPPALTGDEAQIFLKAGIAAVGIGANRYEAGRLLLQHVDADVFLLDDGFQHARLERNADIVLIDGLDPFGGYATIPLGRLREPLSALKRADAFVVTRISAPHRYRAIAHELHRYNPAAPIFQATAVSRRWRLCREGTKIDGLLTGKVGAFCGLGNPQAFWNTLEQLGLEVVYRWAFSDHHLYAPMELFRLRQQAQDAGAGLLVTTEKDRMNLPPGAETIVAPLELAWLEIQYKLDREAEFMAYIEQRMKKRTTAEAAGLLASV